MEMKSSFLLPEKLRDQKVELVMELVKGKEHTKKLQEIFDKISLGDEGVALAEELAQKVLRTFTDSLEKISLKRTKDLGQISKFQDSDFVESGKKRPAGMMKSQRGCYKRRKEVVSWFIVSLTTEDGYAWRKYGQKAIQNLKHPRCYFRCTNKFDQDCKAHKHVQKVEGDEGEIMYQTTYFSQHTCNNQTKVPVISDYEVPESTSMIDFRVSMPTSKKDHHTPPRKNTFVPSITKQESNGDTQSELTDNVSSIDSNVMWPDVVGSEDYPLKMGSIHDQEVASNLYERDESIYFEGLDIKNLISDAFPHFSSQDL